MKYESAKRALKPNNSYLIKRFIEEHPDEVFTLKELAKRTGMSYTSVRGTVILLEMKGELSSFSTLKKIKIVGKKGIIEKLKKEVYK